MSGVIATIPKYQFSATDGTPLASGTLTTYLAGTTTLSNTYQDLALTSANTNPIILDSRGECLLWLDDTKVYKFLLKNAAGVTQWTVDNVSNPSTFLQAGTGAVSTTVQAKLRESVSVKDFGAVGDGTTDDTAAIQTADTAATAAGKTLHFPAGTYRINTGTRLTMGGCNWEGDGQKQSILQSAAGTYGAATYMVVANSLSNFTISKLGFDVSLATFTAGSTYGPLLMFSCTNWHVKDCAFIGLQTYTLGIYVNGGDAWSITDCYFKNASPSTNQNQAINIQVGSGKHMVCRNTMIGTGLFSNGSNSLYSENFVTGWRFGSGLTFGPNSSCTNNRIIGNYCVGGLGGPDVNNTYPHGIECWGLYSQIIGNYCALNSGSGIVIAGNNSIVSGNTCVNNGQVFPLPGIIAYSSLISSFTYSVTNSIISGNNCTDNQGTKTQTYGYAEYSISSSPITGVALFGNYFEGNLTGNQLLAGTSPTTNFMNGALQTSRVGIGAAPFTNVALVTNTVDGLTGVAQRGLQVSDTFAASATSSIYAISVALTNKAATSTCGGLLISNPILSGGTITNNYGVFVNDLTSGTNNYAMFGNVSSGANKWNCYMQGTAPNFFQGIVQIPGGTQAILQATAAVTSGAGSGAGTLTNAPAAGNPTKWIPFNDAGTIRYIPAW
jgi:hypothetical protein